MFFRRERPHTATFEERMENLRQAGFAADPLPGGAIRVCRKSCAIDLKNENGGVRSIGRAGILMDGEIGALVDAGYQKFLETTSGKKRAALAEDLVALHNFEEDLKEGLGQESYYNESLGTVSTFYLYDRLQDRDRGVAKRVWES